MYIFLLLSIFSFLDTTIATKFFAVVEYGRNAIFAFMTSVVVADAVTATCGPFTKAWLNVHVVTTHLHTLKNKIYKLSVIDVQHFAKCENIIQS